MSALYEETMKDQILKMMMIVGTCIYQLVGFDVARAHRPKLNLNALFSDQIEHNNKDWTQY